MKRGDTHVIACATNPRDELDVKAFDDEDGQGLQLRLAITEHKEPGEPVVARHILNKGTAKVLFGILGAYLHSWEIEGD